MKTLIASDIKKRFNITPPKNGGKCFIIIDETIRIEMVHRTTKGCAGGVLWEFICPLSAKRARKLYFVSGTYVHRDTINGFYRTNRPSWYSGTRLDEILKRMQKRINAENQLTRKYFKTHYLGKPTKRYLKCIKHIEAAKELTMHKIVNGEYDLE